VNEASLTSRADFSQCPDKYKSCFFQLAWD
jgi:hypothetical protein